MAGLPEEFVRMLIQTRYAAVVKNDASGWLAASILWSLLHIPRFYYDGHDLEDALLNSIFILPLGLLLGYMIHRTKCIVPAVIVHATNLWGLVR